MIFLGAPGLNVIISSEVFLCLANNNHRGFGLCVDYLHDTLSARMVITRSATEAPKTIINNDTHIHIMRMSSVSN